MKIVVYEMAEWEKPTLGKLADLHELVATPDALQEGNAALAADADAVTLFVQSRLDESALARMPRLRFVAARSTGYDHIDLKACAKRGIVVSNVPSYGQNTVAEHTFGLLLTLSHRLEAAIDRTRKGDFSQAGLRGFDLNGKTLGVVGTGMIGRCVIRIAGGFEMKVLAYDVHPDADFAAASGFRYVPLDTLLAESDIVSLHVPSTPATRHMISQAAFDRMKPGVVLINTARGDIVDVKALVRALAEGKVAAAGLDVLPEEPVIREEAELLRSVYNQRHDLETLLADHVLLRLRNVIVTPHSAFNTLEAVQRIADTTVENVRAFAEGRPIHQVTARGA
jgi:D-lactate dehydrogenase